MNKFILLLSLSSLAGCEGSNYSAYYARYYNDKLSEKGVNVSYKENNIHTKRYCVHYLSYFLPINFWNLRIGDEAYVRKAIQDLNKDGIKGHNMKDIFISEQGIGTPIYSHSCVKITGEVFE